MDHEAVGLLLVDEFLDFADQGLAFGEVEFFALGLGEAVVFGALQADRGL